MNPLEAQHIEAAGIWQSTCRIDRYRVNDNYLLHGEIKSITRFNPSEIAKTEESLKSLNQIAVKLLSIENTHKKTGENTMTNKSRFGKSKQEEQIPVSRFGGKVKKQPQTGNKLTPEGFAVAREYTEGLTAIENRLDSLEKLVIEQLASNHQQIACLIATVGELKTTIEAQPVDLLPEQIITADDTVTTKAESGAELLSTFRQYYKNNLCGESEGPAYRKAFNALTAMADFTSIDTLEKSISHKVEGIKGYLYAPKSKQAIVQALFAAAQGTGKTKDKGERANSPVINAEYFADNLGIDIDVITEIVNDAQEVELDEDDIFTYLEENGLDASNAKLEFVFNEFIQFIQ